MDLIQLLVLHGSVYLTGALVRCECKNKHQENIVCFKKVGLHVQIVLAIVNSTINIIVGLGWWRERILYVIELWFLGRYR